MSSNYGGDVCPLANAAPQMAIVGNCRIVFYRRPRANFPIRILMCSSFAVRQLGRSQKMRALIWALKRGKDKHDTQHPSACNDEKESFWSNRVKETTRPFKQSATCVKNILAAKPEGAYEHLLTRLACRLISVSSCDPLYRR